MSWEDQGRQYHMWFGHGTSADKAKKAAPGSSVVGQSTADRVLALAYGALASLPAAQRRQAEAQYNNGTLPRLKEAMTAWLRATALTQAAFAGRLFGRSADDPVIWSLHDAALRAATATTHDDLREASGKLARAMEAVGIDRWPHFVADAQERARDPATQGAIEKSRQPPAPGRDAIRPVYPVETLLGVGAAAARGAAAAARALAGAGLKQAVPESRPSGGNTAAAMAKADMAAASAASVRDKLARYALNLAHPDGGSKAQWFQQALGFTRQNSEGLARQLVFNEKTAVQTGVTEFGTKFTQTIDVVGANGRTLPVKTVWIKGEDGVARLVTAYRGR